MSAYVVAIGKRLWILLAAALTGMDISSTVAYDPIPILLPVSSTLDSTSFGFSGGISGQLEILPLEMKSTEVQTLGVNIGCADYDI